MIAMIAKIAKRDNKAKISKTGNTDKIAKLRLL
jgi:hypothetical protein